MFETKVSTLYDAVYARKSEQTSKLRHSLHEIYAAEAEITPQRFIGRRGSQPSEELGKKKRFKRMLLGPIMDFVVVISIAQMGISLDFHGNHFAWRVTEMVIATIFFLELVVKLSSEGIRFFRSVLNIIDMVVACTAVIDALILQIVHHADVGRVSLVKLLRLLRLLRVLKLLRIFPSLRAMASSIVATLQPMLTLFVLMGVVVYVFAIPCVITLGSADAGYPAFNTNESQLQKQESGQFNNYKFFGTMARSMITLFHLSMQSDELVTVMRATSQVQHWPPLFFVFFVLLMTLCLFNTVIGVVVDRTVSSLLFNDERSGDMAAKQVDAIENLAGLMFEIDSDGDQAISLEEFRAGAKDPRLNDLLLEIKLPFGLTVEELFAMLDVSCSGKISRKDFIGGLFRIVFSDEVQRECLLRLGQAHMRQFLLGIKEQVISEIRAEHRQLASEVRAVMRHMVPTKADKESSSNVDESPLTREPTASWYSNGTKTGELDSLQERKPFHTLENFLANQERERELANMSNDTIAREPTCLLHDHRTMSPTHLNSFFANLPKHPSVRPHTNDCEPLTDQSAQSEAGQCGSNSEIHPLQSMEKPGRHMQTQSTSKQRFQESGMTGTASNQAVAPTDEPIDVEHYPSIHIMLDDGIMRASI